MSDVVIASLVSGGCAFLGVIVTTLASFRKVEQKIEKAQAVTDVKIEHLTEEVRKHNNFGDRIPRIEAELKDLNSRVDRMDGRISRYHDGK